MPDNNVTPHVLCISIRERWLLASQPGTFTAQLREQYGDLVTLCFHGRSFVMALTARGARGVVSADPLGYDAFWKESFTGLTGPGSIWVLGGEAHRRERQLLSPVFHARCFSGYGTTIRAIARQHIDQWQSGQTRRAIDTTLPITLDVMMRLVFGVEEEDFRREGHKVLTALWRNMYPLIVFFPALRRRWFPLWVCYARAKEEFSTWMTRYLAARRARSRETDDVLGRMLVARYEDGSPMCDADICDELITILLAGMETTATALAWTLYELGRHPAVLEKLRTELEGLGAEADPSLLVRLPYLSAVCNETLRLHTLLAEVARECTAPLECLGYTVPLGYAVGISIIAVHHDPELYPDPDQFIPERFMERTYSPFEFLPFGGGHRRCMGAGLSDYEMRIALAEMVMRWEFEPAAVEREIRHDIAMGPKNGVLLRIKAPYRPGMAVNHSGHDSEECVKHA